MRRTLKMTIKNPHIGAFTLIEMMIVIAVTALLLAITLPVLAHARRQAESVYCQSNLRQMMIAALIYTEDHNDFFPIAYYTQQTDKGPIHFNWDFTVRFVDEHPIVESGILWQGEPVDKVQQCPSFQGESNTPYDPYTGYNYNVSYIGRGQQESISQPARRGRLTQPARVAIFGDGQYIHGANKFMRAPLRSEGDLSFNDRWSGTQGFRHNRQTNMACGDGSTRSQAGVYTTVEPARHQQALEQYNQQHPRSPVGFLSPDNSAYKVP